jgi:type I restriction-modification system DNA methylase subunit
MPFRKEGRANARPQFDTTERGQKSNARAVPEVAAYVVSLKQQLAQGDADEDVYRPALMALIEALCPDVVAINDQKADRGKKPDVVIKRKHVVLGRGEAKDLDVNLDSVEYSDTPDAERFRGYLQHFGGKLFLTNYLEFRFFKEKACYTTVRIGTYDKGAITLHPEAFAALAAEIQDFIEASGITITNPAELARLMAIKTRVLREKVLAACREDDQGISAGHEKTDLSLWRDSFKSVLLPNLTAGEYADLYAQTVTFGLFSARFNDNTPETFTRREANELIPKTNPFLRKFFNSIAGPDLDPRVVRQVDELAELFARTDVYDILDAFAGETEKDPILYFYEGYLQSYDPSLKQLKGAFFTPEPIASYVTRSADWLLREKFGLVDGLANHSMVETTKGRIHKVQILDPSVGTGTFLNAVITRIAESFEGQEGIWSAYVDDHLLPRIHGFEILMAPYTLCHLKLTLALQQRGYVPTGARLGVYLTNSLEEDLCDTKQLFDKNPTIKWLLDEANAATGIKRDKPVMLVLGNPPYNVKSKNKGKRILSLIADYKTGLNEKKLNLDDDYIKFIRFAEDMVERTGRGIVAMITNNSFLDGITHRRMREHLRETFDEIYVLDLHGNTTRKETAPDGSKDDNVFDIQQGVSIVLFVKTTTSKALATVKHAEMYGKREEKYALLSAEDVAATPWKVLSAAAPNHFFVPRDAALDGEYAEGVRVSELFRVQNSGVKTDRDDLFIDMNESHLRSRMETFLSGDFDAQFRDKYRIEDSSSYKITTLYPRKYEASKVTDILYRPFDVRTTYYDPTVISRPAEAVMQHMMAGDNLALLCGRQNKSATIDSFLVTNRLSEIKCAERTIQSYHFPLYLYSFDQEGEPVSREPNFDPKVFAAIVQRLGFEPSPEQLFDYIYAVLHSPTYRSRYGEQLKIDFPRVPFTSNKALFTSLVTFGGELRALHLMSSPLLAKPSVKFPVGGDCVVEKVRYDAEGERVFINKSQFFSNVPEVAWEHWIGGYQPAQKWLKDRKGRALSTDDVLHYEKVIVALSETARLMAEVDAAISDQGSWPVR